MISDHPSSSILWQQVWGLAAMLAAILLSLMIYGYYQPILLTDLGFTGLAHQLGLAQGLLGTVVEPLFGGLSDLILVRTGSRLPQITVGITIVGLLFVMIATLLPIELPLWFRWVFLLLMVIWLVAMIAIRGPILSLLRQFAPVDQIPLASPVIILVLSLVGAIGPFFNQFLAPGRSSIGFMVGAIAVMVGAATLYRAAPPSLLATAVANTLIVSPLSLQMRWHLGLMTILGLGTGCLFNVMLDLVPTLLQPSLPAFSPAVLTSLLLMLGAMAGSLWGRWVQHWKPARILQTGLVAILLLLLTLKMRLTMVTASLLLVGFSASYGLAFTGLVSVAFAYIPLHRTGLSTGLLFGGMAASASVLTFVQSHLGNLTLTAQWGIAAAAAGITFLGLFGYRHEVSSGSATLV